MLSVYEGPQKHAAYGQNTGAGCSLFSYLILKFAQKVPVCIHLLICVDSLVLPAACDTHFYCYTI